MNIGLFWGGMEMEVFGGGKAAAAPKNFPNLLSNENLLGPDSNLQFTVQDLMILGVTIPLMLGLTLFIQYTRFGKAMRAVAQDRVAAQLMGIDVNRVIGVAFILGGALAGAASLVYSLYNNTIYFQMGYRAGLDAFTAAVVGGIGRLPGATLGGIAIGLVRAMSDQYIGAEWSNVLVFGLLVFVLVFRPTGLLGSTLREKV
jgi:branched-chain amino acid transport system permease protein